MIVEGPAGPTNETSETFRFVSNEGGSTFRCRLDGAAFAPCGSPMRLSRLADGFHVFRVAAVDGAGNVDPSPAVREWTLDTTRPQTELTSAPPAQTAEAAATFVFSSPQAEATFECSLDAAEFEPCSSPLTTAALANGVHAFFVRAGNHPRLERSAA
jgi:hypothetical protein